ncbi:hypothetical protein [Lentibacter sp. XHP0401]|uniref:hypothetical protein n=1 Tax=Lentibacter sp. XHP0401 TaxID=2984334 RepID=UPI0021E7EE0D|nr:hypothetical protein [Lentibacter sp. XHP0401]MCV2892223.1 hypothetical protein [Lentibacter sp. XHP0401]
MTIQRTTELTSRSILGAIPAALTATTTQAEKGSDDPIPTWFAAWGRGREMWREEASKTGGENFDTPECLNLDSANEQLSELIARTLATTVEGAACQLEWVRVDGAGDLCCSMHHLAIDNAIRALRTMS